MPLLSCTCLICNNSKWCLLSFVSPSSCTVLLLHCFLFNKIACGINRWAYFRERKAPFATTLLVGLAYFRGWAYFQRIMVLVKHRADPILARAVVGNTILVQYFVCEEIELFIFAFSRTSIPSFGYKIPCICSTIIVMF